MEWIVFVGIIYLLGAYGSYGIWFHDVQSQWKYVLPLFWIFVPPLGGIAKLLVECQ